MDCRLEWQVYTLRERQDATHFNNWEEFLPARGTYGGIAAQHIPNTRNERNLVAGWLFGRTDLLPLETRLSNNAPNHALPATGLRRGRDRNNVNALVNRHGTNFDSLRHGPNNIFSDRDGWNGLSGNQHNEARIVQYSRRANHNHAHVTVHWTLPGNRVSRFLYESVWDWNEIDGHNTINVSSRNHSVTEGGHFVTRLTPTRGVPAWYPHVRVAVHNQNVDRITTAGGTAHNFQRINDNAVHIGNNQNGTSHNNRAVTRNTNLM